MRTRTIVRLAALGCALACASAVWAAPPTDKVNGAYDVVVAGAFTGSGHVAVGAKQANFNVTMTDPKTGRTDKLVCHLPITADRFAGTGTVLGVRLALCGRVEVADGTTIKVARIQCTYALPDGQDGPAGRIVGQRKGGKAAVGGAAD